MIFLVVSLDTALFLCVKSLEKKKLKRKEMYKTISLLL